jgi:imidazolonepropionase
MSNRLIIKNAAQLVTCSGFAAKRGGAMADLGIIEDGALIAEDGIIRAVGPTNHILNGMDLQGSTVVDASGKAVLPGFVDSHTHFPFAGYRPEEYSWRLAGMRYMEIMEKGGGIVNTMTATRKADHQELIDLGRSRLDAMLAMGVTTVEGKSGYGLDLATEIKQLEVMIALNADHPMDIVSTFLGAHAVPPEFKGRSDDYIEFILQEVLPAVAEGSLAQCCDVFCEKGVFTLEQSRQLLLGARRYELAAELGALSADHLLQATDVGLDAMARAGVVATLLPATAFSLKEPYARAREIIRRGCAVALATDFNPGSSFTISIPLIAALAALHLNMTPEEIISALTINGAAALGRADKVGSLDVGKAADIVVLAYPSYVFIPYHLGVNIVQTVIKGGRVVIEN